MDLSAKCGCSHFTWEHDLGGDARGCRYCDCEMRPGAAMYAIGRRTHLKFLPKPAALKGHPLWGSGLGYAPRFGEGRRGIYVMAESLGKKEEQQGRPLVGPTGEQTARMFYRTPDPETGEPLNLDRDAVRGNIVPIKPPFDKLEAVPYPLRADLLLRCKPLWEADLAAAKPKVILATGDVPLRALTGIGGVTKVRGAVHNTKYGPVIATYHPAYLLRGKMHLSQVWQTDLRRALYVARHGVPKIERYYHLYPTVADIDNDYREWVAAGRPPLAFDIETPYAGMLKDEDPVDGADQPPAGDPSYKIDRVSWSWRAKHAITAPYIEPFRTWFQRFLGEALVLYSWNGDEFDVPRLAADGARLSGNHADLMKLWHFLEPALPMGLKNTAAMFYFDVEAIWMNRAMATIDPVLYSAIDPDMTLRLGDMLVERAKREGKWDTFARHYVQLGRILRAMTALGVRTDGEMRKEGRELFEKRLGEAEKRLQASVPATARPRKVYKRTKEQLEKSGLWVEGEMIEVTVMDKPPLVWVYFYEIEGGKVVVRQKIKAQSASAAQREHEATLHQYTGNCDCEVSIGKPKAPPKPKKLVWIVSYTKLLKRGSKEATKKVRAYTEEEALALVPQARSARRDT